MYQRTNRAFYSEQLLSFPGRLHITAEKVCVEVRVKENGQLKFRSFTTEEFNELRSILCEQDFHKEGFEEAYEQELYEVTKRAYHIQNVLFKTNESPRNYQETKIDEYPKYTPFDDGDFQEEASTKDEILRDIVAGLAERVSERIVTEGTYSLSPEDIPIVEEPLFEKDEYDEMLESNVSEERMSSMTSKYIGKFANLHIQKTNGKFAPDKAIFLMSIISLFDGGNKHRNSTILCNKELEQLYDSKWGKYRPGTAPADFKTTFLTLGDESFWHLNTPGKKGEISAQIDPGLVMTLNQQNSRSLLRKTLYNRYLK